MFALPFEKINSLRELNKATLRVVSPSSHSGVAELTHA
jgi:hypothetical protein